MSSELIAKCIEYGITGIAKDFLEGLERSYNWVVSQEDPKENIETMCGWIKGNSEECGLDELTAEQKFFFSVGILSKEIMERIEFVKRTDNNE